MTNAWRSLVAALADDRAREVYALVVLGHPIDNALAKMSPGKRRRVLESLQSAGLISRGEDGWRGEPRVFRDALDAAPQPRARPASTGSSSPVA